VPWNIERVLEFILDDPNRLQVFAEKEKQFYSKMR
jgi:hypothetical protein